MAIPLYQALNLSTKLFTVRKYKDADVSSDVKKLWDVEIPFTKDTTVFTYEGEIGLGVDLSDVKYQINDEEKTITITIPEIKVKVNTIDNSSFKYPFEEHTIFNPQDMKDYNELEQGLKDAHEKAALENSDLMEEAKTNTESVIKKFLTSADATKDYSVIFTN